MGRPGHLVFEPLLGFQPFPFAMPGSQPSFPDSVRLSYGAAIVGFPLAGIGQLITVATGEDSAAVEDRDAPTTAAGRAEKPREGVVFLNEDRSTGDPSPNQYRSMS